MIFNAFQWKEVPTNVETSHKGQLRLSLSAKAALYITQEGYEALAGYGSAFDLDLSEAVTFRVETSDPTLRVFMHTREKQSMKAKGETYANADRMVMQSTHLAEVTRARRLFEIERRAALREIQEATAAARAAAQAALSPAAPPAPAPAVEPVPEPAGEASANV